MMPSRRHASSGSACRGKGPGFRPLPPADASSARLRPSSKMFRAAATMSAARPERAVSPALPSLLDDHEHRVLRGDRGDLLIGRLWADPIEEDTNLGLPPFEVRAQTGIFSSSASSVAS